MPQDLLEQMYCSQQINIPPNLPYILKQYAKAAIRTQPHDLLFWSAAYFRAKANNSPPPVKERLEYPPVDSPSRLSPGFLKVLHKQLGENEVVAAEDLYNKWLGVCLIKEALDAMLKIGGMTKKVQWLQFVAIAAGHLCPSLSKTMVLVCEVLTQEPEGGSAMIPVDVFVTLYEFLARLDCGPRSPSKDKLESTTTIASLPETVSSDQSENLRDQKLSKDSAEVGEKDSRAGLMVWDDLKPPEKPATLRSPRYTEEKGASSEFGVEVLDDAKGPVEEFLTLYPAQESIQSEPSLYSQPRSLPEFPEEFDENLLSHSSLQENEDWIKIEQRKLEDEILPKELDTIEEPKPELEPEDIEEPTEPKDHLETDETTPADITEDKEQTEEAADTATKAVEPVRKSMDSEKETPPQEAENTGAKTHSFEVQDEAEPPVTESPESKPTEEDNVQPTPPPTSSVTEMQPSPSAKSVTEMQPSPTTKSVTEMQPSPSTKSVTEMQPSPSTKSVTEMQPSPSTKSVKDVQPSPSTKSVTEIQPSPSAKSVKDVQSLEISTTDISQPLDDLEIGLEESVTIEHFVKDDLHGSTVTYSTGEIRKGVFGHKSDEVIERDSSDGVVKAAETVHKLGSVEDESSVLLPAVKSSSDEFSSQDSRSFIVLDEIWQEVPGIGPVIPEAQIIAVVEYMHYWAIKQEGMVMPRNINHILCPPLDLPPPTDDQDAESHY